MDDIIKIIAVWPLDFVVQAVHFILSHSSMISFQFHSSMNVQLQLEVYILDKYFQESKIQADRGGQVYRYNLDEYFTENKFLAEDREKNNELILAIEKKLLGSGVDVQEYLR